MRTKKDRAKFSAQKVASSLWAAFPSIISTILLIGLVFALVPSTFYAHVFGKIEALNWLLGNLSGSIAAGNPLMSYVIGGELLDRGVSLATVTVFIVSWVTVGVVQLPAEVAILGKKFAVLRNVSAFLLAFIVAFVSDALLGLL